MHPESAMAKCGLDKVGVVDSGELVVLDVVGKG